MVVLLAVFQWTEKHKAEPCTVSGYAFVCSCGELVGYVLASCWTFATWVFKQKGPKRKAACKRTNLTSNRFDLWFISHTYWVIKCNFEGNPHVWVYIHGVCDYVFPKQHMWDCALLVFLFCQPCCNHPTCMHKILQLVSKPGVRKSVIFKLIYWLNTYEME